MFGGFVPADSGASRRACPRAAGRGPAVQTRGDERAPVARQPAAARRAGFGRWSATSTAG